jgi:hypothetical protein
VTRIKPGNSDTCPRPAIAVSDVVHSLETYDVTTIRAGTPMFLMARKIKAMGIKMVLRWVLPWGVDARHSWALGTRRIYYY